MRLSTVIWWDKLAKSFASWVLNNIIKGKSNITKSENPFMSLMAFEKELQIKLPISYTIFLNETPRILPLQFACDVYAPHDSAQKLYDFVIHTFFNLEKIDKYNLYQNWLNYKKIIGAQYLPIASDTFGNIMAIHLENFQVYFIQLDSQKQGKEIQILYVADSFEEFFRLLYRKRNFI